MSTVSGCSDTLVSNLDLLISSNKKVFNNQFFVIVCQIYGFVGGVSGFLSMLTLAIMAIERYMAIRNPFTALRTDNTWILSNYTHIYNQSIV